MSDFIISNAQKKWTKIVTFWMPIKIYRKKLRGILTMGVGNYIRAVRHERKAKFAHELAVLAVMKDEGGIPERMAGLSYLGWGREILSV